MPKFIARHRLGRWISGLLMAASWGCGAQSNVWGRTVPAEHLETFEVLLSSAHAAYDRGDLERALAHATKAYAMDPESERASVMLGFVHLSLAGGDPFLLASSILEAEEQKTKDQPQGSAALQGSGDGDTAGTLGAFKNALGITTEELSLMGHPDTQDPALPLLIPKCVEEVRVDSERLQHVHRAIRAVCPFVDPEAKVEADYRQDCEAFDGSRGQRFQAHFLWAFAHLTEALAFNTILTYASADPTGQKSNLELRVEKLKALDTSDPTNLELFLSSVETVERTLDAVLPVGGACSDKAPTSQLRATLNDMLAVDRAFGRIPGMPAKITASIKKAMAKVIASGNGVQALRGDFTKKMSKSLSEKVDALAADPAKPLTPEQKTQLCSSVGAIASGVSGLPAVCAAGVP